MADRNIRNDEVVGSIPSISVIFSTTYRHGFWDYVPQRSNWVYYFWLFDSFFQHGHQCAALLSFVLQGRTASRFPSWGRLAERTTQTPSLGLIIPNHRRFATELFVRQTDRLTRCW